MSSPLYKHTNENSAMKQRKVKSTNASKSSTNLDTRTELADLVKRKAEIAVSIELIFFWIRIRFFNEFKKKIYKCIGFVLFCL